MTPLERLYPNRCYDCLAVVGDPNKLLCSKCERGYEQERERRRGGSNGTS